MTFMDLRRWQDWAPRDVNAFWEDGGRIETTPSGYLAHADYVYCRALTGTLGDVPPAGAQAFAQAVAKAPLAGRSGHGATLRPHLSAYLLGALNLLALSGHDHRGETLGAVDLDPDRLIDRTRMLPRWPRAWSHHTWRVSHWIGGVPAILLNFARHDPRGTVEEGVVGEIMAACDRHLIADGTGLLRAYRSEPLQALFRLCYRARHDPAHGDIGGVVHVHWVNHVLGRPYRHAAPLLERCFGDLNRYPFLEDVPYCLDFDYLFLLRTGSGQSAVGAPEGMEERVRRYGEDLVRFLAGAPDTGYPLHKRVGALAALHETALMMHLETVPGVHVEPMDIIRHAYWL